MVEPTPLAAAQEFLAALLNWWVGNEIADGWIAAAVLARRECLATLDRDFTRLLPARQLVLLRP